LSDTDYKGILVASTTAVDSEGEGERHVRYEANARSIYEEGVSDLSVGRLGFVVLTSHAMRKYNFTDNVCVKTR